MNIDRKEISELISSGVSVEELCRGVEIEEPGILGLSKRVIVKTPKDKRNLLFVRAQQLIEKNSDGIQPLTNRNILQKIGGGPLKKDEWLQISETPDKKKTIITGTRGVLKLERHTP